MMKKIYVLFFLTMFSVCATAQHWTVTEGAKVPGYGYKDPPSVDVEYIGTDESGIYLNRAIRKLGGIFGSGDIKRDYELTRYGDQKNVLAVAKIPFNKELQPLGGNLCGDEVVMASVRTTETSMTLVAQHYDKLTLELKGEEKKVYEIPIPSGCEGNFVVRSSREGDMAAILMQVYSKESGSVMHLVVVDRKMELLWDMPMEDIHLLKDFLLTEEGEVVTFGTDGEQCEMHVLNGENDLKQTCSAEGGIDLELIGYSKKCVLVIGKNAERTGIFGMAHDMKKNVTMISSMEIPRDAIINMLCSDKEKHITNFILPEYTYVRGFDYDEKGASAVMSSVTHVTGDYNYYLQSYLLMARVNTMGEVEWIRAAPRFTKLSLSGKLFSRKATRMHFNEVICRNGMTYVLTPERPVCLDPQAKLKKYSVYYSINTAVAAAYMHAIDEEGNVSNISQPLPKNFWMLGGLHYTTKDHYDQVLIGINSLMILKWVIE